MCREFGQGLILGQRYIHKGIPEELRELDVSLIIKKN
jgi:hypothetical protein